MDIGASAAASTQQVGDEVRLQDISFEGFTLSSLIFTTTRPLLRGVLTGPSNQHVVVELRVYMFDSPSATVPMAFVYGNTELTPPNGTALVHLDNGIQTPYPSRPVRLDIEYYLHAPTIFGSRTANVPP